VSSFSFFFFFIVSQRVQSHCRSHQFFLQASEDLTAYSDHAKRHGIEVEDVACLFRRQRATGPTQPIEDLVRRFLPLEYVEEVVQVARANNMLDPELKGR
jgi:hypothetical protein